MIHRMMLMFNIKQQANITKVEEGGKKSLYFFTKKQKKIKSFYFYKNNLKKNSLTHTLFCFSLFVCKTNIKLLCKRKCLSKQYYSLYYIKT